MSFPGELRVLASLLTLRLLLRSTLFLVGGGGSPS
jgi:hypothetical protein